MSTVGSDALSKGRRRVTFAISGSWPTMRMRPTHPASSAAPRFSFNRCTSSISTSAICRHRPCRHGGSQQCIMCLLLACNGMQPCRSDRSPLQRSSSRPDPFAFSSRCLRSSISPVNAGRIFTGANSAYSFVPQYHLWSC